MKDTEFFQWWLPADPAKPKAKPRLTRWKMQREYAEASYPGATPYLPSREVRALPESQAEVELPAAGRHGVFTTIGMAEFEAPAASGPPVDKSEEG
ncbi:MAG: hypothetical protein HYX47_10145 [Burkholderiales bacterium]|nr:hypothetical protein [Burkholderiales bacterium]